MPADLCNERNGSVYISSKTVRKPLASRSWFQFSGLSETERFGTVLYPFTLELRTVLEPFLALV